jgi:hypothetical protein
MNKGAIVCKLHEITDHYLLGAGEWPADREFLTTFWKTLRRLGLEEEVPNSPGTTRWTDLGKELNLDLLMVFVGAWQMWEIPYILEDYGYLEETEAEELCTGPLMETERKLRWYVLRAYLEFCNRSYFVN